MGVSCHQVRDQLCAGASSLWKGPDVTMSSSSSPSGTGCPLDLYPSLLLSVLGLKDHLVSYSHIDGDSVGILSVTQTLSFLWSCVWLVHC